MLFFSQVDDTSPSHLMFGLSTESIDALQSVLDFVAFEVGQGDLDSLALANLRIWLDDFSLRVGPCGGRIRSICALIDLLE